MNFIDMKLSWRTHKKNPLFTLVNILGLAVAMAAVILIAIYVRYELSYDAHWQNADRIYRVTGITTSETGERTESPTTVCPLQPLLSREIPGIEECIRITNLGSKTTSVKHNDISSIEKWTQVDTNFFKIFQFKFIYGTPDSAFNRRFSAVITQSLSLKLFGDDNPIGKHIDLSDGAITTVTGVIADIVDPTHLLPFTLFTGWPGDWANDLWTWKVATTYVMLNKDVNPMSLQPALNAMIEPHLGDIRLLPGSEFTLSLELVTEIHLYSKLHSHLSVANENPTPAIKYVHQFTAIGLIILIIACLNFINLSTARSAGRGKQVGISKALGASYNRFIIHSIVESVLITVVSALTALIIVQLLLPTFSDISGQNLVLSLSDETGFVIVILIFSIVIGVISGIYPAFILAGFRPIQVLRGELSYGVKGSKLRAALVVVQFSISIILITCVLIITNQMEYVRDKPLGYNSENMIILNMHYNPEGDWHVERFRNELDAQSSVTASTGSSLYPISQYIETDCIIPETEGERGKIFWIRSESDFPQTIKMNLLSGRFFKTDKGAEPKGSIIINQAAAKLFGLKDPIGEQVDFISKTNSSRLLSKNIVGLIEDFHNESLHHGIKPIAISIYPNDNYVLLRISQDNIPATIKAVENIWLKYGPTIPFNYEFLDDVIEKQYRTEHRMQRLFTYFTILAIFIACLGLFALTAHAAERRTKEIGIRKVLGASVFGIVMLLSKKFLILVLIANLIAAPVAYFLMQRWLENFVYRISIEPGIFPLAGILSVLIALLTVSAHAVRAAMTNPVNALRHE